MDVVKLRKLALKSKLDFGVYDGVEVGEILRCKKSYLIWLYYNRANISYVDEIMKELDIPENFIIDKPGANPDMYEKLMRQRIFGLFGDDEAHKYSVMRIRKKAREAKDRIKMEIRANWQTLSSMAWKNQGH